MAYFLFLAWGCLTARFANDDMMNMARYWDKGWGSLLAAQFKFWSSYYRPLGGLLYMGVFEAFGLNPLPYRIIVVGALALNTWLIYVTGRLLSRSAVVAFLAALLSCFHTSEFILYYNTSQLYDVLCFSFWFLAFNYYARRRLQGRYLNERETAVLLAAYILALNSKEMAVSFPVMLAVFELAFIRETGVAEVWRNRYRMLRMLAPIAVTGAATLLYIAGKTTGPDSLSKMEAYRPVITIGRFLSSNAHYAAELFYTNTPTIQIGGILSLWTVMGYLAARLRRSYLAWGLGLAILGTLPIAFIPNRGGGCLYIPAFGYALYVAAIVDRVVRWLSREPLVRWVQMQPAVARLLLLAGCIWWYGGEMHNFVTAYLPAWRTTQDLTWSAITQLQQARHLIGPGAKVLFMNDPFTDWDIHFITQLVLKDKESHITLQRKHDHILSPAEIAEYTNVLTFENGILKVIR